MMMVFFGIFVSCSVTVGGTWTKHDGYFALLKLHSKHFLLNKNHKTSEKSKTVWIKPDLLPSMVMACSPERATAEGKTKSAAHFALPRRFDN